VFGKHALGLILTVLFKKNVFYSNKTLKIIKIYIF
jgi:hypothetical protein